MTNFKNQFTAFSRLIDAGQLFGVHRSSYKYWKCRPDKPDESIQSYVVRFRNYTTLVMAQPGQEYRRNGNAQRLPDGALACRQTHERAGAGQLSAAHPSV
jgi:putative transposase